MKKISTRLTRPQTRVLGALLEGFTTMAGIAEATGMDVAYARHTLDALTRRSLVTPVTETSYATLKRAAQVYAEQGQ